MPPAAQRTNGATGNASQSRCGSSSARVGVGLRQLVHLLTSHHGTFAAGRGDGRRQNSGRLGYGLANLGPANHGGQRFRNRAHQLLRVLDI